jgi:molybdopterin/thiamine biosynthesis adenylyltransferase
VMAATPLVCGATVRLEGQVSLYQPGLPGCACYQCVYPHADFETDPCRELGILPPVAGIVGSIQATEALKLLLGVPHNLAGSLLLIDAERMEFNRIALTRNPRCPACGDSGPRPS